jgi:L-ascorbate metabolism protein UlaG (beta-lactamase superfamily)
MNRIQPVLRGAGIIYLLFSIVVNVSAMVGQDTFAIHNLGHGSLYFEFMDLVIHIDPYSSQADYNTLPDADLIFITHGHSDHYDMAAINKIKTDSTLMICTQAVKDLGTYSGTSLVMKNGDSLVVKAIPVKAVPAYNIVNSSYHPKGTGNGYIFTFGEKKVYVAGDTESIPEMDSLGTIDVAFLPMNLPYTMSVNMAAEAARKVKPGILYIYHFGASDTASLRSTLSDEDMEIRMGTSLFYESSLRIPENPNSQQSGRSFDLNIYPNPVRDHLILDNPFQGAVIYLYDLTGLMILQQKLTDRNKQWIDLSLCKPGLYILKIQLGELNTSYLILKE